MRMAGRRDMMMAGAALLAAPGIVRAQNRLLTLRFSLDIQLQGPHSIFFLARERGYFRNEGLDVIIDQGEGSAAVTTRVMSGAYDAGFGDINAIIEQGAKRPGQAPVMVYQFYNRPPFALIVKKSSAIENLWDIKGHSIGAPAGAATARLIPVLAKRNGIDFRDVTMTNVQSKIQEQILLQGQVDALASYDNNLYFNLVGLRQNPDRDFRWFRYGDYGLDLYANGVMVSRKLVADQPEKVAGLLRAINRATKETAADANASMSVLMSVEPLLNAAVEKARIDYCFRNSFTSAETDRVGFGDLDDVRLASAIGTVSDAFELPRKLEPGDVFNRSFLPPKADRTFRYTSA